MTSTEQRAADIATEFASLNGQADPLAELWNARPILRHLHTFARARGVAPLAVLGAALARISACVPPEIVLPALVGGYGSLNLFVALVGPSGAGKDAADATAEDALDMAGWRDPISDEELYETGPGSGEGIAHHYARRLRSGDLEQVRSCALMVVPEADTLAALGGRQGSTLVPTLRQLYTGRALSWGYADKEKRLTVRAHAYRAALIVGVQPARAKPLLDDADGGLPQRFLWMPAVDPAAPHPKDCPPAPQPVTVAVPGRPHGGRLVLDVDPGAADEVREAHWRRSRGEVADELDGHRLFTRLKVAAGLAALDGHLGACGITAEDWHLAGLLMAASDRTRDEIRAALAARASDANRARGRADAEREAVKTDHLAAQGVQRASDRIRAALDRKPGEWISRGELRKGMSSDYRAHLDEALSAMELAGDIEAETVEYHGQSGVRYRRRRPP